MRCTGSIPGDRQRLLGGHNTSTPPQLLVGIRAASARPSRAPRASPEQARGPLNWWLPLRTCSLSVLLRLAALDLAGKTRVQEKMRVSVRQMQRAVGARGKNFRKRVRQG